MGTPKTDPDYEHSEAALREADEPRTAAEVAAAFVAGMPDVMSFPPLPPSPAEVGDLILQTREHVQALGWLNRELLYPASQVRAVMSECAIMAATRERNRLDDMRSQGERVRAQLAAATNEIERLRNSLHAIAHHDASGAQIGWKHWKDMAREALGPNAVLNGRPEAQT